MSWTRHHIVAKEDALLSTLHEILQLPIQECEELLWLGSIYVDGQRAGSNFSLRAGQVLRMHFKPKRYETNWVQQTNRYIYENDDFLVFDKPHGVPVHATLDNRIENILFQLNHTRTKPLYITHRLDIPTGGLLLLAKKPAFQARFNRLLQSRKTVKIYEALTDRAVPLGLHVHYMEKSRFQPKRLFAEPREGTQPCELEIIHCEQRQDSRFRVQIHLRTGRTQQIRAQLAFLGSPICGDEIYGSDQSAVVPGVLPLIATQLTFTDFKGIEWRFYRDQLFPTDFHSAGF